MKNHITSKDITFGQYLEILKLPETQSLGARMQVAHIVAGDDYYNKMSVFGAQGLAEKILNAIAENQQKRDKSFKCIELKGEQYELPTFKELANNHWDSNADLEQVTLILNELERAKKVEPDVLSVMAFMFRKKGEYVDSELHSQRKELFKDASLYDATQCFFLLANWEQNFLKRLKATLVVSHISEWLTRPLRSRSKKRQQNKKEWQNIRSQLKLS